MNKIPTAEELESIKYDLAIAGRDADKCYTAEEQAAWRIIGEDDYHQVISLGCDEYLLTGDTPDIMDSETMRHYRRELALACGLGDDAADKDILARLPAKREATAEEIARLTDPGEGNYSADDAEGAEVIAEDGNGCILYRLPNATSDIKYAIEGATGDIVAGLDYCEAVEEWS